MHNSPVTKSENSKFSRVSLAVPNLLGFFAFIAIGIIITGQVISGINVHNKESEIREKIEMLVNQKSQLIADNTVLIEDNNELREMSTSLSVAFLSSSGNSELKDSYLIAMKVAGLTEISGSGIEVKMFDSLSGINYGIDDTDIIHSQDVRYIVDLLVNSGATAIDINGERIVSTTSILCAGPTIRINDRRYPAPFVIHAICDPVTTYDILFSDSRILDRMTEDIVIDISKQDILLIPAFADADLYLMIDAELEVGPGK